MAGFKGYKRQIKLEFDYKEVKEGVPHVSKQMAVLNSEFKKSSAEAMLNGSVTEKLGVQHDYLKQKIEIETQKVAEYEEKLKKATEAKGANKKAVENANVALTKAQAELGKTKAELELVSQELEKNSTIWGKTAKQWEETGTKMQGIGKTMTTRVTLPILAAGAAAFKLASDYEENLNKVREVFDENSVAVEEWAKTSLEKMGLARSSALETASLFGDMGASMGLGAQQNKEYATSLTQLSADLASFKNIKQDVAKTALSAIYTGETESLKKLGVVMTEANLQQFAYSQGINQKVSEMTQAEKVQLRYNFVMEATSKAHGDFERTGGGAANQMRIFTESLKELGASFGEHILPVITPFIKQLNEVIKAFAGLSDGTKKFIIVFAGIIATIGPVIFLLGGVFKAIGNISTGLSDGAKALSTISKAGSVFKSGMDSTAFFGFAKWALIIIGVAAAVGYLIHQINILRGTASQANQSMTSLSDLQKNVLGSGIRGYAVGSNYIARDQIAVVHKGEAIIPADENPYNPNARTYGGTDAGNSQLAELLKTMIDEVILLKEEVRQQPYTTKLLARQG